MVRSGFRNFCFWNRFVTEMLGTACGLNRESFVGCFVWYLQKKKKKTRLSQLSHIISYAKHGRIYGREWLMCVIAIN